MAGRIAESSGTHHDVFVSFYLTTSANLELSLCRLQVVFITFYLKCHCM